MPPPLRLSPPAKINLHLRVGPPAADGFHPLLSWMVTVGLHDTLTLTPSGEASFPPAVRLICDDPALPCDRGNLVVRAGHKLAEALGKRSMQMGGAAGSLCDVTAALQKRIPTGAGLGGGSSDGAIALQGLNRLWNAGWDPDELAVLSAELGSDLPFFFHGPSSICSGRGQFVRPTPAPAARWAILALPGIHMPTPAVYRRFDEMGLGNLLRWNDEPAWSTWAALPAIELLPLLVNDLEAPAFAINPDLGRLRMEIEQLLGRPVRMSGSGSSLFTLYDTEPEAIAAGQRVGSEAGLRALAVEVAPTPAVTSGP